MKRKYFIFILFLVAIFFSNCNKAPQLNFVDSANKKQGLWRISGSTMPNSCYKKDQIVSEGFYKDDQKEGLWLEYYCNGNVKSAITFDRGVPNGVYRSYYETGMVREEGISSKRIFHPKNLFNVDGQKVSALDSIIYEEHLHNRR